MKHLLLVLLLLNLTVFTLYADDDIAPPPFEEEQTPQEVQFSFQVDKTTRRISNAYWTASPTVDETTTELVVGIPIPAGNIRDYKYVDNQFVYEPAPIWNADTFMLYCMQTYLTGANAIHAPAVMRAIDRNTKEGWQLLGVYADANGLSAQAAPIILDAKAVGANVE